jgi:type I restriction enzyme, S subunit
MRQWPAKQIKELGRVVTGKTPPKDEPRYFTGEELFVSPKDLEWEQLYVTTTETRVSAKAFEKFKNQVIPKDTVMFTSLSFAFGKIGIASQRSLTNQQINSLIVNNDNSFRFVFYLLKACTAFIFAFNSGIDTPIVPKSVFEKIQLRCPTLDLQKKIAGILWTYDQLIETNKRRIELLENMAEDVYREWFIRFRFPGYDKVPFRKGIPATWTVKQIGEIASFTMGQSPPSESYNESGDGLPFHQGVGTYGRRFPLNTTFCNTKGRKAQKGDILFSVRAPVGRLNIADCEMIIGRGLAAVRHKKGNNSYLFYLLKVAFAQEDIIGNGSIFNSVGKDELAKFPILEPDDDLVTQFQSFALSIDRQIDNLSGSIERLRRTRDMLLPRLISGKISVETLDITVPPSMTALPSSAPEAIAHA